jgi:hypothetical protein
MIDERSQTVLQNLVRRESRSILQYVSESFPWATAGEQEALAQFLNLVEGEREAVAAVARHLARQRMALPYLGTYPAHFTDINFVSLEHLLPVLVKAEHRALADAERDLGAVTDGESRTLVEAIVAMKRRHIQTLESMAAAFPEKYSTIRGQAS